MSQENFRHNSFTNNSDDTEFTKSHSKTMTKYHDQNSAFEGPNVNILELENQIIKGLVQKLTSEFSLVSDFVFLNERKVNISEISKSYIQNMISDFT